jgi:hypothetical protein
MRFLLDSGLVSKLAHCCAELGTALFTSATRRHVQRD